MTRKGVVRTPAPKRELADVVGAVLAARALSHRLWIDHPADLEILAIAAACDASIGAIAPTGARASLTRRGARAILGVAGGLSREEERFALAHEIGHLLLHQGATAIGICTGEDLSSRARSRREREANAFAVELTMPEALVQSRSSELGLRWKAIAALAAECRVSLTAMALRLVHLAPHPVGLVIAKDDRVDWFGRSASFGRWIPRGTPLDPASLAFRVARGQIAPEPVCVPMEAWLSHAPPGAELVEHAVPAPLYGAVATLLWRRED